MTDLAKATPYDRPWHFVSSDDSVSAFIYAASNRLVGMMAGAAGREVCAANAELAVRAVNDRDELIAALAELVSQLERSNAVDDHGHAIVQLKALADARSVLTKARGEGND